MRSLLVYILFFILLSKSQSLAQDFYTIKGKVGDINNANVSIPGTTYGTTTDEYGNYNFLVYKRQNAFTIQFSAVGYKDTIIEVDPLEHQCDTIILNVEMHMTTYELPEVSILGIKDFFNIKNETISDLEFLQNQIILLTNKTRRKSKVLIIDFFGNILQDYLLDAKYQSIHLDCFGNLILINDVTCLQLYINTSTLSIEIIEKIPTNVFLEKVKPCIFKKGDFFLFQVNSINTNEFFVDTFHNKRTSYFSIIANDSVNERSPYVEFFDRKAYQNALSVYNELISRYFQTTPENENVITLHVWDGNILKLINNDFKLFNLISWYQKIESRPYLIEAFTKGDTIYFFSISEETLFLYNIYMEVIGEKPFDNSIKSKENILTSFIQDVKTEMVYAVFSMNGFQLLGRVDFTTGSVSTLFKTCEVAYPSLIRVFDGYVYCVYYDSNLRLSKINRKKIKYE
jgi:hypothetical protein